jgi:hypothetical protein
MRARPRSVRRQFVDTPDALQRWDRAYQYVLHLAAEHEQRDTIAADVMSAHVAHQEDDHEPRRVCSRVHVPASPDPDD